jgi:fibronectin type 3 domain-containing protein
VVLVSLALSSCAGVATASRSVAHSVTLTWDASPSPTTSGYNIYRSTVSGGGYARINSSPVGSLSYVDTTISGGAIYYYVATAVDVNGDESTPSNEMQVIIP